MPSASLSVLLSWVSAVFRLLLANAIGCSTALSGAQFLVKCIPCLAWRRLVPRPTPNICFHVSLFLFIVECHGCILLDYVPSPAVLIFVCVVPCPFTLL